MVILDQELLVIKRLSVLPTFVYSGTVNRVFLISSEQVEILDGNSLEQHLLSKEMEKQTDLGLGDYTHVALYDPMSRAIWSVGNTKFRIATLDQDPR